MAQNLKNKKCDKCRRVYQPTNGRQKYCPACSPNMPHPKLQAEDAKSIRGKIKPCIMERIEKLGSMNEEYIRCLVHKDKAGLLNLAMQYETGMRRPMVATAHRIRLQAQEIL